MNDRSSRVALADFAAGVITCLFGAFFLWGAFLIRHREAVLGGPEVFPKIASLVLLACGIGIVFSSFWPGRLTRTDRPTGLVLMIVGVGIAYVYALDAVGYFLATLAFSPLAFAAFGGRGLRGTVLPGILSTVAIYLIFFRLLGIYDPPGKYIDFAALIRG